jgi:Tfp pilus assembly protein PilF
MTPGLTAFLARDFERAITELQKVIEMDPNFPAAHSVIAGVYVQQGMYQQAIAEYQKVLDQSKGVTVVERAISALMAHAYAKWEKPGKARKLLEELLSDRESSNTFSVSAHAIAEIYIALGEMDAAFEWLNKALEQHDVQMVSIKVNPTLDRLRSDSRFPELVAKVGIPS